MKYFVEKQVIGHFDQDTALHFAAHIEEIVQLLPGKGADVLAMDSLGLRPLHYAAGGLLPYSMTVMTQLRMVYALLSYPGE